VYAPKLVRQENQGDTEILIKKHPKSLFNPTHPFIFVNYLSSLSGMEKCSLCGEDFK
jgi:hypothetical protein